jgi:hypothetical protein
LPKTIFTKPVVFSGRLAAVEIFEEQKAAVFKIARESTGVESREKRLAQGCSSKYVNTSSLPVGARRDRLQRS